MTTCAQGRSQRECRGHTPNRQLNGFLRNKTCIVGAVLSTRSVLWVSNMPKIRWRPGHYPQRVGGAHDAPPDLLVGWGGGTLSPIPISSAFMAPDSRAFDAQLLCPNVNSWLRPCMSPLLVRSK